MIEVKDRIPTKPNRIRITPENGDPFYAVWNGRMSRLRKERRSINISLTALMKVGIFQTPWTILRWMPSALR